MKKVDLPKMKLDVKHGWNLFANWELRWGSVFWSAIKVLSSDCFHTTKQ